MSGEVHGVLGANGAGKTTLLNVLGGMLRPDAGTVEVGGSLVAFDTPRDAWREGIALVHQHFTLVPALSVLENLALGVGRGSAVRAEAERLMAHVGLTVPLEARIEELGVGDRQRAEILKALLKGPRILILDEPTAVLAPPEIEGLFSLLRGLAADDRAVVLVALSTVPADHDLPDFVSAMVGSDPADPIAVGVESEPAQVRGEHGRRIALLEGVSVRIGTAGPAIQDVSLEIRSGEVVGIAGVEGNGQHALALLLAGRLVRHEGTVALPEGIGLIPQDRTTQGVIADFDLTENVALALHDGPSYQAGPWLRWDRVRQTTQEIRDRYGVVSQSVASLAGTLSGGNQQRLVVGRELVMADDLLIAENPTRGLDVVAAAFVHEELRRIVSEGVAVVLLSTDLDEVLALADRVFVMTRGRLVAVPDGQATREGVAALMLAAGGGPS